MIDIKWETVYNYYKVLNLKNSRRLYEYKKCICSSIFTLVIITFSAFNANESNSVTEESTTILKGVIHRTEVVNDLNDRGLSIELSKNEKDTKIYCTNPTINVVVNEIGEIVEGIWKCTVTISMDNLKAFGKDVENATIVMENTITL